MKGRGGEAPSTNFQVPISNRSSDWINHFARHIFSPMAKAIELKLKEGDRAPAFTTATSGGGKISLADFKGRHVILYFYPRDDTPGCTKEACAFRDHFADFKKKGAVVLGVSTDRWPWRQARLFSPVKERRVRSLGESVEHVRVAVESFFGGGAELRVSVRMKWPDNNRSPVHCDLQRGCPRQFPAGPTPVGRSPTPDRCHDGSMSSPGLILKL